MVFATLVVVKFPPRETKIFSFAERNSQDGVKKHRSPVRKGILYFNDALRFHFLSIKNSASVEYRK